MSDLEFDVVVLGAGPAGEVAAGRLAEHGRKVAIVEPHLVGGECSFYACMPSKALLRPAQALREAERVPGAAQAVTGELDAAAALTRRDEVIHNLDDEEQLPWLRDRGIELLRAGGRLDGERRLRLDDGRVVRVRVAVVLATGSVARLPPIPGLREADPWTTRQATTARAVPESLVVLGGGVAGCELSQAWRSLGARVSLLEAAPRLVAQEEPFVSELLAEALHDDGVDVRLGVKATSVDRDESGVRVQLEDGTAVEGRQLLVAAGRRPASEDIGLETVGLEPGHAVEVDDGMQVPGREWLYAVGDVNGRIPLTHMGKYQARVAADRILGVPAEVRSDGRASPRVIFTEPQVAAVGLTLDQAREQGRQVRAVDQPTGATAGGSFHGKGAPGTSRLVVDEQRRVLAGATFTGVDVGEWLHAATIAVVAELPLETLWHAVPAFPTRSEVWLRLLDEYGR